MPTVQQVFQELEKLAPQRYAMGFDRVGLQVGDMSANVTRAVVSLDRSLAAIEFATSLRAELLISHHPLLFEPAKSVTSGTHVGRSILKLVQNNIAFIAAHTNWDAAEGGVNDTLAQLLGLEKVKSFGMATPQRELKLVFFCPVCEADTVINAVSEAGAGTIGLYRRCAFSSTGQGSFTASEGAQPAVGEVGGVQTVEELRVEMVLPATSRGAVERALRRAHSYEEPAYDFLELATKEEQPAGRWGELPVACTLEQFGQKVSEVLNTHSSCWGDPQKKIRKVAVFGGAADSEWRSAQRAGADVLLVGEAKQHEVVEASESGMCIVSAGHYATEQPGCAALCARLKAVCPEVEWSLFTPNEGFGGRPFWA